MFMKIYGYVSCPFNLQLVILFSESYRTSLYETENTNKCNEINPLYYSFTGLLWLLLMATCKKPKEIAVRLWIMN